MKIVRLWNKFFFEPISMKSLAIFRIVFGLVVLDSLVGRFADREFLYGPNAIVSLKTVETVFQNGNPLLYFFGLVPQSHGGLTAFFIALILINVCVILGLFTRAASILLFIGLIALSNRNFFAENSGDDLIRINCFFLMFTHAGAAWSLDRLIKIKRGLVKAAEWHAPWAWRLLQLQLAYVYLDTVFIKLHGHTWRDGTALYYALHYAEFKRFDLGFLFHYLWQIKIATWSVVAIELAMGTLVWFRKPRYWCLGAALILHVGINLIMQFPVFQYVMIASLINFIEPARDSDSENSATPPVRTDLNHRS